MSTTPDMKPDIEELLRSALSARAELVRPEDLATLATVTPLRPRWQSPWVLLATAAAVLLILGVVFQGFDSRPRSDDLAPKPQEPQLELPEDVGRDWQPDDLSSVARLDLDGDGVKERVEFLAEPTPERDGRTRVQTTLSSTGEETYGLVALGTTIGITALEPIDADSDGDQELVLSAQPTGEGGPGDLFEPVVLDLRDGLLVRAPSEDPELLATGYAVVPGSEAEHYDLVHLQSFEVQDGTLVSTRSVNAFARSGMTLLQPDTFVMDTYEWTLAEDGVLRPGPQGCLVQVPESTTPCAADSRDDLPSVTSRSTDTIGVGEEVALEDGGLGYRVRVEAGEPPTVVVDGPNDDSMVFALDLPDPRVHVISPSYIFSGDAAVFVTSASDPAQMQLVVQTADQAGLVRLEPVGEIAFGTGTNGDGRAYRSWLTEAGVPVTVVEGGDGSWEAWRWVRVGSTETFEMAALPWGTLCFEDVEDPTTGRAC